MSPTDTPRDASFYPQPTPLSSHSSQAELPAPYEVLVELEATLSEHPPNPFDAAPPAPILKKPVSGTLRAVQGPLSEDLQRLSTPHAPVAYHAFLSIANVNVPLMPSQPVRRLHPATPTEPVLFELRLPGRAFTLAADAATPPELVDVLERILRWFCRWGGEEGHPTAKPLGAVSMTDDDDDNDDKIPPENGASPPESNNGQPAGTTDRFARAGDRGVQLVETIGTAINNTITRKMSASVDGARATTPRSISTGGRVTQTVLAGARTVVGAGASVASVATEKISTMVGKGLSRNPVTRNFAEADEATARRKFHDNLMSGLLAFGRVYVAADKHGKIIIENLGARSGDYAGAKYGAEAERTVRDVGRIALDGYRIIRFPQKLGATGILKGALKSTGQREMNPGNFGRPQRMASGRSDSTF